MKVKIWGFEFELNRKTGIVLVLVVLVITAFLIWPTAPPTSRTGPFSKTVTQPFAGGLYQLQVTAEVYVEAQRQDSMTSVAGAASGECSARVVGQYSFGRLYGWDVLADEHEDTDYTNGRAWHIHKGIFGAFVFAVQVKTEVLRARVEWPTGHSESGTDTLRALGREWHACCRAVVPFGGSNHMIIKPPPSNQLWAKYEHNASRTPVLTDVEYVTVTTTQLEDLALVAAVVHFRNGTESKQILSLNTLTGEGPGSFFLVRPNLVEGTRIYKGLPFSVNASMIGKYAGQYREVFSLSTGVAGGLDFFWDKQTGILAEFTASPSMLLAVGDERVSWRMVEISQGLGLTQAVIRVNPIEFSNITSGNRLESSRIDVQTLCRAGPTVSRRYRLDLTSSEKWYALKLSAYSLE